MVIGEGRAVNWTMQICRDEPLEVILASFCRCMRIVCSLRATETPVDKGCGGPYGYW